MSQIKIVYEDNDIIIINKPAGLVVHEEVKKQYSLVDWLKIYRPEIIKEKWENFSRPGIVHRLDKDTSGLMIIAKTPSAYNNLKSQIQKRQIKKIYLGLVTGKLIPQKDIIVARIGRKPGKWGLMTAMRGKEARTEYKVIKNYASGKDLYSLVKFNILTGRTHQIRVHCKFIGHPIIGDLQYGTGLSKMKSKKLGLSRQFLHAYILGFKHPISERWIEFISELPDDLMRVLKKLKKS